VGGVVAVEIFRRQRYKQEDQAADDRKRMSPQHAPARLVTGLVVTLLDMLNFAFRRQRLNLEPAGGISWAPSYSMTSGKP
jgi:hypothetical protein